MKTKIFVCSSSAINELVHDEFIEAIPILYKFSDDELFEDENELSIEACYNRLRYEKNSGLELLSIGYERISDYLKKAIEEGYDNALFILPNRAMVNLSIPVKIALEENKEINVIMYQSNEISLPLAYIAFQAQRIFNSGHSIVDTWNELVNYEGISNIFVFTPIVKSERNANFEKQFKNGTYQLFKNGKFLKTLDNRKTNALEFMLDEFKEEIKGKKVIPFILVSDRNSKYNEILLNNLVEIDDDLNKDALEHVRLFNLPLWLGLKCGINSVAIGYIECKNGLILEKK